MKKVPRIKRASLKLKAKDHHKFATDTYKRPGMGDVFTAKTGTVPTKHRGYPENQK